MRAPAPHMCHICMAGAARRTASAMAALVSYPCSRLPSYCCPLPPGAQRAPVPAGHPARQAQPQPHHDGGGPHARAGVRAAEGAAQKAEHRARGEAAAAARVAVVTEVGQVLRRLYSAGWRRRWRLGGFEGAGGKQSDRVWSLASGWGCGVEVARAGTARPPTITGRFWKCKRSLLRPLCGTHQLR